MYLYYATTSIVTGCVAGSMASPFAFLQPANPLTPSASRGGYGPPGGRAGVQLSMANQTASGHNSRDTPVRGPPGSVSGSIDRSVTASTRMGAAKASGRGAGMSSTGRVAGSGRDSSIGNLSRNNSAFGSPYPYNDEDEDDFEDDEDDASNFDASVDGSDFRSRGKGKRSAPVTFGYADDDGELSDFDEGDKKPRGSRANSIAGTERSGVTRSGPPGAKRRKLAAARSFRGPSANFEGEDENVEEGGRGARTRVVVKEHGVRRQAAPLGLSGIAELQMGDVKEFNFMEGALGQRAKDHQTMMALMYNNTTPDQQERQEALRRANFRHHDIRSTLEQLCGVHAGDKLSRMVATVAKTFVMELVEEALAIRAETKQTGPLRPVHLLEAYTRLPVAKFGSESANGAFGAIDGAFFGGL